MRKSTFYGLAAFSGVCAMVCAYEVWEEFFMVEGCHCSFAESDFMALSNAIKTYAINAGRPPSTEQGLMALVQEPTVGPKPRRWTQVMKKVPTDPWGRPYDYRIVVEEDRRWRYEIHSAGIDGIMQTGDDYVSEWGW